MFKAPPGYLTTLKLRFRMTGKIVSRTVASRPQSFVTPSLFDAPKKLSQEQETEAKQQFLTFSDVKDALDYNPETGIFTWSRTFGRTRIQGCVAGFIQKPSGYWVLRLKDKNYRAHRVAMLWMNGEWPAANVLVDHINGNKLDNRFENLRVVSSGTNLRNVSSARKTNMSSGLLGVSWSSKKEKFFAHIGINYKVYCLGYFDDKYVAQDAYKKARREWEELGQLPDMASRPGITQSYRTKPRKSKQKQSK